MKFFLSFSLLLNISFGALRAAAAGETRKDSAQLPKALYPLIRTYPSSTDIALKALKKGVDLFANGSYESALSALPDDDSARTTALEDYALLYRARAYLMLDRTADALKTFQALKMGHAKSPLIADALRGEARAQIKMHNPKAALAIFKNEGLEENAETLFYQGRAFEDAGNRIEALECFLKVYTNFADSQMASDARQRILALSHDALIGPKGYRIILSRAENLLQARNDREARSLLLGLAPKAAPDKLSNEKRLLLLAEAEFRLGKAAAVLSHLKQIREADAELHAHALYLEGACYRRLNRIEAFLNARDRALRLHPQSPFTEQLLLSTAAYFDIENDVEHAQDAYHALIKYFPGGAYAERALWRVALFSYIQNNYESALASFAKIPISYRNSRTAGSAVYWIGKCYEKLGDSSQALYHYGRARTLLNYSYYGQRAREAEQALNQQGPGAKKSYSGINPEEVKRAAEAIPISRSSITEPSSASKIVIERACQLLAAGLTDLAIAELRWNIKNLPDSNALSFVMAHAYQSKNDHAGAIRALYQALPDYNDHSPDSLPKEVWELLFPVRYADSIALQAARNNLDPYLILGVIRQESSFNEAALSFANARGLMQILPATGRREAPRAGVVRFSTKKLFRADINIAIGAHYLDSLIKRYNGKVEPALAAYSAGEARVDRWISDFNTSDMAEFVERIPFSETRNYVKQVLTNHAHYGLLHPLQRGMGR